MLIRKILLSIITFYQRYLSPLKGINSCRFYPTCSEYAYQAIEKYGILKGSLLSIWRIFRCNPFNIGGYDPVP